MHALLSSLRRRWLTALCALGLASASAALALTPPASAPAHAPAAAVPTPYKLRIVGGLAGVTQYLQHEEPFWTQQLQQLSAGRYSADIVPFDRAGVPGSEMLRMMQLGVLPFGTVLMSALSGQYPQYTAADLPGMAADIAQLRASVAALRPFLEKDLRQRHGVELLAIYAYPAQVLFCKKPIARLADLAGRRVRVSSGGQADYVSALGALPVNTAFAQLAHSLESGDTECAITGTLSGHSLGLYRVTQYLYTLPITWGLGVFAANQTAWAALPADLRALLLRELPQLEARIWDAAERDTAEGIACNSGAASCALSRKGRMVVVNPSAQDQIKSREIFSSVVLPRWQQRCTVDCAAIWNQTVGPVQQIQLPPLR